MRSTSSNSASSPGRATTSIGRGCSGLLASSREALAELAASGGTPVSPAVDMFVAAQLPAAAQLGAGPASPPTIEG